MTRAERYPSRAVMFGSASSLFPAQLADHWRSRGIEVTIISYDRLARGATVRNGVPILSVGGALNPSPIVRAMLRIGSSGSSGPAPLWTAHVGAKAAARKAMRLAPDFVFGHEVFAYGPAVSHCRGVPRVLFPWGFDIHDYADSSPAAFRSVHRSLHAADLIVPSSNEAADHICRHFGVPRERVRAFSWGIELARFRRADASQREAILRSHGVGPSARIVMNVRRCDERWGASAAIEAFTRLARTRGDLHFIGLGNIGPDTPQLVAKLRSALRAAGLDGRATLFEGEIDLDQVRDLMSVTDVSLSLPTFTDMRSASVLQAASCGAAPVVSDQQELRHICALGFEAKLVDPGRPEQIAAAAAAYLDAPASIDAARSLNTRYLAEHENRDTNLDRLLDAISALCRDRRAASTAGGA